MKKSTPIISILLLSILILTSCASTSKMSASDRDGLSFKTAIIAKSISYEYEWIRENYPGSQTQGQALSQHERKYYDIITIVTASGDTKELYFDISKFYGRGF